MDKGKILCHPDIRIANFDKLVIGTHEPEVKVYIYHKLNYYNIKLNLPNYIMKNSRMLKPILLYKIEGK